MHPKNTLIWLCFLGLFYQSTPSHAQFGGYIDCLLPAAWEGRDVKLIVQTLRQRPIVDTATVIDRHAIFNADIAEPAAAYIWIEGQKEDINFLIDSPQITIAVDPQAARPIIISGSPGSELYRQQRSLLRQLSESQAEIRSAFQASHPPDDSLSLLNFAQLTDSLESIRNARITDMIEANPSAMSSWHLFASYYLSLPYATASRLFGQLSSFRLYPSYQDLAENLFRKRPGIKAADFTLPDLFGDVITLSTVSSRFTLIDFSCTTLSSCRQRHNTLRKIYETYHPRGLEIITISYEFDAQSGKQALLREHLPWLVVVQDMNATTTNVAHAYNVVKMPDNVLLDSRRTVLGRDLSIRDLTVSLTELVRKK